MSDEKATIVVRRARKLQGALRAIEIYVDGEKVGAVANGAEVTFEVPPGRATVQCSIDWIKSQPADVLLKAGDTATLDCAYGFRSVTLCRECDPDRPDPRDWEATVGMALMAVGFGLVTLGIVADVMWPFWISLPLTLAGLSLFVMFLRPGLR